MQLVVATASGAPTRSAKAGLERRDPRALRHPAGGDRPRRRPRPRRRAGRARERDLHQDAPSPAARPSARRRARRATSSTRRVQALLEADLGLEAEPLARGARCRPGGAVTPLTARSGPCSTDEVGAHDLQQRLGELEQARLGAAGDVEDLVGDVGLGGEDVGARDVVDVDEVHRLQAVAEDQRRLAGRDALHPADQHLGVERRGRPCAGRRR